MKFRMKVLLVNLILAAAAFAISGYLLISRSFSNGLDREVTGVLEENQLLQATIISEMVNLISRDVFTGDISDWQSVGGNVKDTVTGTQVEFLILDADYEILYTSNAAANEIINRELFEGLGEGEKQYIVSMPPASAENTKDAYVATVGGMFKLDNSSYYVSNWRDVTSVFTEKNIQMEYFRFMMLIALTVIGAIMFVVSWLLTRPIEKLSSAAAKISGGDYSIRTHVTSTDEIGELSRHFNLMAEAVSQHIEELKEENRRQEDFVGNFTHELKTPLTSVIGYADMIRSQDLDDRSRVLAADYIFSEGMRLESMSMKLFDLLLVEKGDITMNPIYVPEWMKLIKQSVLPLLQQENKKLYMRTAPCTIHGDPVMLRTVFINIIDNARKASQPEQVVKFWAEENEDHIVIGVADHGCGIPDSEVSKITEAFYMVDKSRSRESGGAGLGLSLAVTIIKRHGAKLVIESKLNGGTIMKVLFPKEVANDEV